MSFWPRLRRRSRGRRRSSSSSAGGKANPYASRDNDKYATVHAELEAERARFAAEQGVSVSVVRFISRSSRGWVSLPPDSSSSNPAPVSGPQRPIADDGVQMSSASPARISQEFSLPPPAVPLPTADSVLARGNEESLSSDRSGNAVAGLDERGGSRKSGRLVRSRKLKDETWTQMKQTARVFFVKVLVISRALEASSAFAFTFSVVFGTWNRGKSTFQRVFSALATQLLTTVHPFLSLESQVFSAPLIRAAKSPSPSSEMKVAPITEITESQDFTPSNLVLPVLPSGSSGDSLVDASSNDSISTPLLDGSNKLPKKTSQTLKSKLFRSSPSRKPSPAAALSENSSPARSEDGESIHAPLPTVSLRVAASAPSSPARAPCKTKSFFIRRTSSKDAEGVPAEEDVERDASAIRKKSKRTKSHDLFSRSPNKNDTSVVAAGPAAAATPPRGGGARKNVSRSQEQRCVLKSLAGKKKSSLSQEFSSSSPPSIEELALPSSTVESLEALAFPFKTQRASKDSYSRPKKDSASNQRSSGKSLESSSAPLPSRGHNSSKSACSSPLMTFKSCPVYPYQEEIPAATGLRKPKMGGSVPSTSDASSQASTSQLRKVKTASSSRPREAPHPSQFGELGRSDLLSSEVLGAVLLLSILGFLLLGRITAILGTSCLCLVLSNVRRFLMTNLTTREKELIQKSLNRPSRVHSGASSKSAGSYGGSPLHERSGLQTSEYRKRVLIEGLLERGNNRRGTTP